MVLYVQLIVIIVMAIKYKSILKTQPGVPGGGEKKYYASIVIQNEVTVDDLVKDIEKFSALSEPDIYGVVIALENVITTRLAQSEKVKLDKLGTFTPTLHSEGRETEKEIDSHVITGVGVNYRPGARILKALKDAPKRKIGKEDENQ
jgi:predicted histone-like DNA-binding protein